MVWRPFFVFFISSFAFGQSDVTFRNYTLETGLPSNTIYEVFQAPDGQLFLGHEKGCSVFNGLSFLTPKFAEKTDAVSNFIAFSNGNIMYRNFQGNQFILKENTVHSFVNSTSNSSGFPTYIQDGQKHYVIHGGNFYTIDSEGKTEEVEGFEQKKFKLYRGVVDRDKCYFIAYGEFGTIHGCFDLKTHRIEAIQALPVGSQCSYFKGRNSIFWINESTGESGTYSDGFKTEVRLFEGALPSGSKITSFVELNDGRKIIATFNGVYILDKAWKRTQHYLEGIQCSSVIQDSEGGIWIGSLQNGLFHVPNIDYLRINTSEIEGENVKFSKVIAKDNFIYAGTYDGRILKFNDQGELLKTFDLQRNAEIQALAVFNNDIYVYCARMLQIDGVSGKIVNAWQWSACKSVVVEKDRIICASSRGLLLLDKGIESIFISYKWLKNALPISENKVLLEATDAVLIFNLHSKKIKTIQTQGTDICALNGKWYFRTDTKIMQIDAELHLKCVYTSKAKIQHLYVSNGRLNVIEVEGKSFQLYGSSFEKKQQLPNAFLKEISFVGELNAYRFEANNNTIVLRPKSEKYIARRPVVAFVSAKGKFSFTDKKYTLPFSDNELILTFDIRPNFQFRNSGELYYRIVELDRTWKKADKNAHYVIDLLRIPSGDYTLEWYAETDSGRSKIERSKIHVNQPFYFQWWFIVCLVAAVAGITYLIIRWWSGRIKAKNQRELEEQQLKMRALNSELAAIRSQMNPHFIFNSLSSIQTKILNEDRVEAYKTVNTFATLLRQALQFTRKEFIGLNDELEFARNYILLEQTRTGNTFDFIEEVDKELDLHTIQIPSLFLQPFIENAIRHGLMHSKGEKTLKLQIYMVQNGFEVTIEDNGIGRKASHEMNSIQRPGHTSFATNAIQDRIDILSQTKKMSIALIIEDLEPGTRVKITFKKNPNASN